MGGEATIRQLSCDLRQVGSAIYEQDFFRVTHCIQSIFDDTPVAFMPCATRNVGRIILANILHELNIGKLLEFTVEKVEY